MEMESRDSGEQLREMAEKVFQLLERLKLAELAKNKAMEVSRQKPLPFGVEYLSTRGRAGHSEGMLVLRTSPGAIRVGGSRSRPRMMHRLRDAADVARIGVAAQGSGARGDEAEELQTDQGEHQGGEDSCEGNWASRMIQRAPWEVVSRQS